jgi:bifunctional non-homologous end joining protein LigD
MLFCQIVATVIASRHPRVATVERAVRARPKGTVYVDFLQNIMGKTLATAYSARASTFAGVSTPLRWEELDEDINPQDFTISTAPARFRETGDLWARLRTKKTADLEAVFRKYEAGLGAAAGPVNSGKPDPARARPKRARKRGT